MTLTEVPVVSLKSERSGKFIVVELTDLGGTTKTVIRGGVYGVCHRDIHLWLKSELLQAQLWESVGSRVLGGGELCIVEEDKKIFIDGESGEFGMEPDRSLTVQLVQVAYPDFSIVVE